jgi:hypothetical protein
MVAPGFLENPEVRRWLNGIEPAWKMLEFNSLNALRHEPSTSNHAIRLEPDLADGEISESAVAANALILLRRAAEIGGLKLTATGNLSRAMVYFDRYSLDSWPQSEVGVILWSLSASAHDWLPRVTLTRLCASPAIGVLWSPNETFGSSAVEARILRRLVWFGLLAEFVDRRLYRKAPLFSLFDRFEKYNVQVEGSGTYY